MSSSDVKVLGLAVDAPSQVKSFLQDTPVSYPVAIVGAAGSEMAKKLGIPMTPELMQLGNNEAISNALVEIAVGMGKSEAEISNALGAE